MKWNRMLRPCTARNKGSYCFEHPVEHSAAVGVVLPHRPSASARKSQWRCPFLESGVLLVPHPATMLPDRRVSAASNSHTLLQPAFHGGETNPELHSGRAGWRCLSWLEIVDKSIIWGLTISGHGDILETDHRHGTTRVQHSARTCLLPLNEDSCITAPWLRYRHRSNSRKRFHRTPSHQS